MPKDAPKPISLAEDRDSWARQPKETGKAWAAFQVFRDLDPASRSLGKAGESLGRKPTALRSWSARYRWAMRASAYDAHKDQQAREQAEQELKTMRAKHVKIGQTITGLGMIELTKHIKKAQHEDNREITTLGATTAANLAERGLRIERLNRGMAESVTEERSKVAHSWSELVAARAIEEE